MAKPGNEKLVQTALLYFALRNARVSSVQALAAEGIRESFCCEVIFVLQRHHVQNRGEEAYLGAVTAMPPNER